MKKKKTRKSGCCNNNFILEDEFVPYLFTLKVKDSKKNINEDNSKDEEKLIKEIIKYKNGDIEEIYNKDEDEEFHIIKYQNGDVFKINKKNNLLKNGLLYHKNMKINIYDEKIVNLISILLITNNEKNLNQDDSNEKFFELDNNFVIKINFKDEKNIIIDENILEHVNVILFIFDEIDENYLTKIKSFYDKIKKIKKETIIIGIITFKDYIKNKEISKSIQELSKSLNIFFEEEEEGFDMKDTLQKIKNKYLTHYENKIIENEEGTFFGKDTNNKKEGYGIMLYKNGSMYFGEWENDRKKGNGILYDKDNNIYKGEWNNNELISGEIRYFSISFSKENF